MISIPGISRHVNDTRNHPYTRSTTCLFYPRIHHVDPLMVVINTVYRYLPATQSHGRFSCVGASVQAIFVPARTSATTCDRLYPSKHNLSAQIAGQETNAARARMTSLRIRQAVLYTETCGEQGCLALHSFQKERGISYLSSVMLLHRSFYRFSARSFRLIVLRELGKALASCAFMSSD